MSEKKRALWKYDVSLTNEEPIEDQTVFQEELEHIQARRDGKYTDEKDSLNSEDDLTQDLVGLAFSGGGIRSATFGLGILEALKEQNLLKKIDYLSTVSGGGYIGAWLSANCKRAVECDIRACLVKDDTEKQEVINQFKKETMAKAGCSLRRVSVKGYIEEQRVIQNFKLEFKSNREESKILLVDSTDKLDYWIIAGFSDEGVFKEIIIDDSKNILFKELKKKPADNIKLIELAALKIGRTNNNSSYAILIVAVKTNTPLKWTIAGVNKENEFKSITVGDGNDKLSLELKRAQLQNSSSNTLSSLDLNIEGINKYKIIELALSFISPEEPTSWLNKDAKWKKSINHLRRNSNYLSPKLGFFSADMWTMVTIWLRNTLLIQLLLILAITSLLILPRPLFILFQEFLSIQSNWVIWHWGTIALYIFVVASIASNLLRINKPESKYLTINDWKVKLSGATIFLLCAWLVSISNDNIFISPTDVDSSSFFTSFILLITKPFIAMLLVLAGFFLLPTLAKLKNLIWSEDKDLIKQINYTQEDVQSLVILPMLVFSLLFSAVLQQFVMNDSSLNTKTFGEIFKYTLDKWPVSIFVIFISLWLLSICSIRGSDAIQKNDRVKHLKKSLFVSFLLAPLVSSVILQTLLSGVLLFLSPECELCIYEQWVFFVWTAPLLLYAFSLVVTVLIGMVGRESSEAVREWWSRYSAWLAIYGFCWVMVVSIAIYGPWLSAVLLDNDGMWSSSVSFAWVTTTIAGIFASKSSSSDESSAQGSGAKMKEVVAKVAPFIFIIGLLLLISTVLHIIIASNSANKELVFSANYFRYAHWYILSDVKFEVVLLVFILSFFSVLFLAFRVDINEFSLNAFYRSRLVRCYLGATRFRKNERHPQYFTGFDEKDDLKMAELIDVYKKQSPTGPFHIINCALNLGGSRDLSLHTRHSAIFTLTPLRCGSSYKSKDYLGYRGGGEREIGYISTNVFGGKENQPTLGQAVSISGAAASPNMGYQTSPVMAFLMTLFNARLGWWFPNPDKSSTEKPSPDFSLFYLFRELLGAANEKSDFLAISDGGHFENLAVYELIKRKCKVIIVSDGECDPNLQFEGLGRLIRMCEVDLGVKINIDVSSIQENKETGWSKNRCAVGQIEYSDTTYPEGVKTGWLIYLKASMNGYEDTAIQQYKATHPTFPHETTGDQFYGEDQFESYRKLGYDVAEQIFSPVANINDFSSKAEKLNDVCSPVLPNVDKFADHASQLMDLWSTLSEHSELDILDKELTDSWPDNSDKKFRSAFYLCSEMIQLMENVYLDLSLEETWEHPDNKGWRTLFEHWAQSNSVKKTWALTRENYGLRFQFFLERKLIVSVR